MAGFTTSLISAVSAGTAQPSPQFFGDVALQALEALKQRTAARVGHRTVMDALIPFAEALAATGDLKQAAQAARKGGEATKDMTAKLGRATYVGQRQDRDMPPDPGAMALVAVVEGLAKVLG